MSCKYSNILGEPGKGIHEARFLGLAFWDLVFSFLLAYAASKYFSIELWVSCLIVILLGIMMHTVFCVKTKLNSTLGL